MALPNLKSQLRSLNSNDMVQNMLSRMCNWQNVDECNDENIQEMQVNSYIRIVDDFY
jgi:hypothetical protein